MPPCTNTSIPAVPALPHRPHRSHTHVARSTSLPRTYKRYFIDLLWHHHGLHVSPRPTQRAGLLSGRGAGMVMEAAELYEAADDAEQAAALYLDAKALARAEPLMKRVSTPKLIQSVRPRCRVGYARCKVPPCVWRLVADRNQSIPETCSTTRTLVTLDLVDWRPSWVQLTATAWQPWLCVCLAQ